VVFLQNEPLTLESDLIQIHQDAKEFEAIHGRDHGNGWLLNHPIQKCILFQVCCRRRHSASRSASPRRARA
jgi:hypothetical protein